MLLDEMIMKQESMAANRNPGDMWPGVAHNQHDLQGLGLSGSVHIRDGNITLSDLDLHKLLMGIVPPAMSPENSSANNGSMTPEDIERVVKSLYMSKSLSNFNELTQICLIVAFAVLILFGACGNGLVCYVVAKNPNMRTPRNIFIINLAISDLTLCCFTQPFNLMKVSMAAWHLDDFMCKFVPMFAGTNVFVSTISITAIALDRFQVIVYPTKDSMRRFGAAIALISIWIISLLMASPLLIFNVKQPFEPVPGMVLFYVCVEQLNMHFEKAAYSIASMVFQYIVPIVIVTVAHARICNKLKYRMINQNVSHTSSAPVNPFQKRKNEREARRKRKTNMLLVMIAVIFIASWLPLNVFNIMADFNFELLQDIDKNNLVFPICHLLVLSSACMNPVLYGWLNDNFRKEFLNVLCCSCCHRIRKSCNRCCGNTAGNGNRQDREMTSIRYQKANNGITGDTVVEPSAIGLRVSQGMCTSVSNVNGT